MKEEFEEDELVEVRDYDHEEWIPAVYVGVLPGYNSYWTRAIDVNKNSEASPISWKQIRKIQKDKTKSPETNPTRKEEAQLRDDANWAIEQALAIGHREYGEVVRAAKLIIESQKELINFIGQINQL